MWFSQFLRAPQVESKLSHDVLNSTQVPFSSANSRTLGTFFSPRIWSVNIEVPNNSVDKDSWELSACYPWRIFDSLSTSPSTRHLWIIMADFRLCLMCTSYSQANIYHYALQQVSVLHWVYLRTPPLPFRRRPPQSNCLTCIVHQNWCKTKSMARVVFQGCMYSHLSYACSSFCQCKCTVKMHRVFSSWGTYSASARRIQFHWVHTGDSGAIVTSFMQARN